MIDKHLMKLRARDSISPEEEQFIRSGVREIVRVGADETFVRAHEWMTYSTILVTGLAARQRELRDGSRVFTELHTPGDFTDLHSFTLKYLEHDVVTLTPCSFAIVPHDHLRRMTERFPHLTEVYWFATNLDAAIHREWVVSMASRTAMARMCHLFCELYLRLEIVELARNGAYDLPLTQQELGDLLGITPVHANRTLQQLRGDGIANFASGVVSIYDFDALKRAADFDPAYLYLRG